MCSQPFFVYRLVELRVLMMMDDMDVQYNNCGLIFVSVCIYTHSIAYSNLKFDTETKNISAI